MNAPVLRPANDIANVANTLAHDTALHGIARHVSAEGCQFVIVGKVPSMGRRIRFVAAPDVTVIGTIRWVLGERIGVAFDRRIDAAAVAVLCNPLVGALPIELLAQASGQQAG